MVCHAQSWLGWGYHNHTQCLLTQTPTRHYTYKQQLSQLFPLLSPPLPSPPLPSLPPSLPVSRINSSLNHSACTMKSHPHPHRYPQLRVILANTFTRPQNLPAWVNLIGTTYFHMELPVLNTEVLALKMLGIEEGGGATSLQCG